MKKLLALLTALLIALSCLSGCGGGVDKSKQKPEADKNDTTVTVWTGDGGGQAVWEKLVDEWNATTGDEKDIFIEWETIMEKEPFEVALQNDQLPEIAGLNTMQIKTAVSQGKIVPIAELPGGEEFLKEYDQAGVDKQNTFDGKQYSVYRKAVTAGLAYNKDLFKEAGIVDENGEAKAPETIAELREAAKKITALGEGKYGFALPLKFGLFYTVDVQTSHWFPADNPAQKTDLDTLTVTYPGYKDMYSWIFDLKDDGSLFPGAETLDNDTARAYFSAGTVGMIPAVSWDVGVYTTQFVAECDWDVVSFPIADGRGGGADYQAVSGGFSISNNALKNEKTAKATMEVYKFIYSLDTRTALFENGIELSCKTDVLENADMSKVDPRFLKFAEFVDEDFSTYVDEAYAVEGVSWQGLFEKMWFGEISRDMDAAIKDLEKRSTEALRKAVKNGSYDVERQKEINAQKKADFEALKAKRIQE